MPVLENSGNTMQGDIFYMYSVKYEFLNIIVMWFVFSRAGSIYRNIADIDIIGIVSISAL